MRRLPGLLSATAVLSLPVAVLGAGAPTGVTPPPATVSAHERTTGSPIRHVVIIYQENHSFDDVLGKVCEKRRTPCDGYTGPVHFRDGRRASNVVQPDIVPFVAHTRRSQGFALQNRWDHVRGCMSPPHICVSHVLPRRIPNLSRLARRFAVSDATFASDPSASFGEHLALAAGTLDGFVGKTPVLSKTGARPGRGWGCHSRRDSLWRRRVGARTRWVPSCIPTKAGNGPYRRSPVEYRATVMQRLEQRGFSWHLYQGHLPNRPSDVLWSICPDFFWCQKNRFTLRYDSASRDFVDAARAGRLPSLSLLMPLSGNSQHNYNSMRVGDNYIGRMVRAAERGPQWRSTAIFITYDDCGCFYDHVNPPRGLGIRNPMVIVSPWVKRTYTDNTTAVQPYSMLAFVQHTFGLAPLTRQVSRAYDYRQAFDFSQQPLRPVRLTHSAVAPRELKKLAQLPSLEHDPT